MASTIYTDYQAPAVTASWLNDVNTLTYTTAPTLVSSASLAASTGAGLVGYARASGVTTTQQQINDEQVSVFRFMTAAQIADVLAMTLTLDVTSAINAAVTACTFASKKIFFPAGKYLCAGTISTPVNVARGGGCIFQGEGILSQLVFNTTGDGILVSDSGPLFQNYQVTIRDLSFTNITNTPASFIHNNKGINTVVDGCFFMFATVGCCIINDNAYGLKVKNSVFFQITGKGILYANTATLSTYSYVNSVEGCDFSTVSTGIEVQGCNALLIETTIFQECNIGFYANPITNSTAAFNIQWDACWFERNTTYDIQLNSNPSFWCEGTLNNCQFSGFSSTNIAHIDLGAKSKLTISGVAAGNTVQVSGSAGASVILIRASNFVQVGTFAWTELQASGRLITPFIQTDASGNLLLGVTASAGDITNTKKLVGGLFSSATGTFGSPTSGVNTVLTTLPNVGAGTWLITAYLNGTGSPAGYSCMGVVTSQGAAAIYTAIKTATNLTVAVSGLDVTGNQTTGGVYSITWSALRLS